MKLTQCKCKSAFQDKAYGVGIRAYNPCSKKPAGKGGFRCTVCGKFE